MFLRALEAVELRMAFRISPQQCNFPKVRKSPQHYNFPKVSANERDFLSGNITYLKHGYTRADLPTHFV